MAEAVEIDLRNLGLLLPLVKRLAPGLDVQGAGGELRERVAEELDYEIEAQNHRTLARAWRGHPFAHVPTVHTSLSSRRVLVTELLEGRRFEEVKALDDAERDRFGEIVFRFFFGTLNHLGRASGDPHPGNYLLLDDGRVGFLDFGLMRVVDPATWRASRRSPARSSAGDAAAVHRGMTSLGYLPDPAAFEPERLLAQLRLGGEWYFEPGCAAHHARVRARPDGARLLAALPYFDDLRQMTLPPAGAAHPPHGGPGLLHPRRAARARRLGRARRRVPRRTCAGHRARRARRGLLGRPPPAQAA